MTYRALGAWTCILSVMSDVEKCVRFRVNNGLQISCWNDVWCGNASLKVQFPSLYLVDRKNHAIVAHNFLLAEESVT